MQTTLLFHLPIICTSKKTVLHELDKLLDKSIQKSQSISQLVFTPNPEQIVMARRDRQFLQTLRQANYLLPDGIGLVWASRILAFFRSSKKMEAIEERITGVDVVVHLLQIAKQGKHTVLIVGGRDYLGSFEGEAYEDQASLKQLDDGLFWTEAYQDKREILPVEEEALQAIIKRLRPSVVFVALGAPDQEQWLVSHREFLSKQGVRLGMAVGGSFDVIFKKIVRAPQAWQGLGLEWLWRLIQEPWRKRRQLRLFTFMGLVIKELILPQRHLD